MTTGRAVIVGGGIGGLTAAVALRRVGWEVEVFERAPELSEVGAGLSLWRNALAVLDRIGLLDAIRPLGIAGQTGGVRLPSGELLLTMKAGDRDASGAEAILLLHRAELLAALLEATGRGVVRTGAELVGVANESGSVTARFKDGREAKGDLLIGADGLRSVVRSELFGARPPRYGGYRAWRGVVRFDPARPLPGETWGPGRRFGQWGMTDGRTYWYVAESAPPGTTVPPGDRKRRLLELFRGWHEPIEALIEATDESAILINDVFDRPPLPRWSVGRAVLLGDAAHPMTPDMGQGACQAIEDAVVLADSLAKSDDVAGALREYEAKRIPRTSLVVRESRRASRIAQWSNPLAVRLRSAMMRSKFAARMQAEQLARMTAPAT